MDRKEFKKELISLYARCGSYIMQKGCVEKDGVYTSTFLHPTQPKNIVVSETDEKILCVLIYNRTSNASIRYARQVKTLEEFKKEIYSPKFN